jgi:glyoxylase-like metal-dependent hydrolase (beta-lactamase superfamily II)
MPVSIKSFTSRTFLPRGCLLSMVAALVSACAMQEGAQSCSAPDAATVQRLYVINCGQIEIKDLSRWSPPGVNVGKAFEFSDNCYLIQHRKGWMLWDSGLPDSLVATPEGVSMANGAFVTKRAKTLASGLAEIGVAPAQITRIAFSHTHADHVGNANMFAGATLYMQQTEYDVAFGPEPNKFNFYPSYYEQLRTTPVVKLHGDYDVFGDGSVTIISTPGHTPGHQSLMVRLPKKGTLILSGDLAHFEENWKNRFAPAFNFNHDQSVASMEKVAALLEENHAVLWINHDKAQSDTIPHSPAYVE